VVVAVIAGVFAQPARPAEPSSVTLSWVGDMAFSSRHGLPPRGGRNVFARVARYLRGGDITTGNLEGTLGRGGPSKCAQVRRNCHAFQAPSSYAGVFRRAGFEVLNLANNHSHDFGAPGLRQTLAALRRAGIAHTGLAGEIRVKQVGRLRVAFLGFAPYPWASSLLDIRAARRLVARASRRADVVVVFIHAGAEGARALHTPRGRETAFGENRGETRRFAHAVVDAGADAVLGSGPHVLRGIECYHRGVIAYSLGNFAGYRTLSVAGVLSLSGVLRLKLDENGRLVTGRLLPVRLVRPGLPRRDPGGASIRLVRRLSQEDFGRRACRIGRRGAIAG
jgi:capsule synthesis protein PGA_cap